MENKWNSLGNFHPPSTEQSCDGSHRSSSGCDRLKAKSILDFSKRAQDE